MESVLSIKPVNENTVACAFYSRLPHLQVFGWNRAKNYLFKNVFYQKKFRILKKYLNLRFIFLVFFRKGLGEDSAQQ